jgi:acylphosphatase
MRRRVVVHGRVQGVFFRDTTRRLALEHGLNGWVRNTWEGTVEAVFEGPPNAVQQLVEFVHRGPAGALVERVDVFEEDEEGLTGFSVG